MTPLDSHVTSHPKSSEWRIILVRIENKKLKSKTFVGIMTHKLTNYLPAVSHKSVCLSALNAIFARSLGSHGERNIFFLASNNLFSSGL